MADTNYFRKTASDLFPGKTYYFQFRWKYADGTYSEWSATKTSVAPGSLKIEQPTLATGLTAATASFGVTVSWDGTYSSSTFLGFKSINIYASTSNLGSSTTTDISTNLVGSMTVDQVKNQITIGSTLLKNTLSLSPTTVYTTPIYFYYITINENNEVYKSGGVATYTRINSTGINPTQANFVDLLNGVISIENLVAGNGQFTEYLRAGTRAGDGSGARIEISGSSSNINSTSGGTILPGFTIYNSAGGHSLRAPLSGGLTVTGSITGSTITGSTFELSGEYPLTITNTLRYGSPSLTWGNTASPLLEIYQFAAGAGSVIAASGYLFINAGTRLELNVSDIYMVSTPSMPSGSSSNAIGNNKSHRNIYATTSTGTPSGGSDGDVVLVYTN